MDTYNDTSTTTSTITTSSSSAIIQTDHGNTIEYEYNDPSDSHPPPPVVAEVEALHVVLNGDDRIHVILKLVLLWISYLY